MKGLLLVIWLMLVVPAALGVITTFPWDISEEAHPEKTYHALLQKIRNEVGDANERFHGIPVFKKSSTSMADSDRYLLVELRVGALKSITLSLERNDLYLMGYSDTIVERGVTKCRHHVFKDQDAVCKRGVGDYKRCGLCDGEAERRNAVGQPIKYESNYGEIEKNTPGKSRKKLGLGFNKLKGWIDLVHGSEIKSRESIQNEAQLLLTAIQMISEATRFYHIENMMPADYKGVFNPSDLELCYENNWSKASRLIKAAPPPTTQHPNFFIDIDCHQFYSVEAVREDIALLCRKCREDATNTLFSYWNYWNVALMPRAVLSQ